VFISGSRVNLREQAAPTAAVVTQLPIATECALEEKADSGWWRIRCGDAHGWTKAELLSAEKPTLGPLLALSGDAKLPLKDRFEAVVRAVALAPQHPDARARLWELFVEQERAQVEKLLAASPPTPPQEHMAASCEGPETSRDSCFESVLGGTSGARWHRLHFGDSERLGKRLFVSVKLWSDSNLKPGELWIRSGTIEGDAKQLEYKLFTFSHYVPSDTLRVGLEPESAPEARPLPEVSKSQHVLSDEALRLLRPLEGAWSKLTRANQEFFIAVPCSWHGSVQQIILTAGERRADVQIEIGQDSLAMVVVSVQRARDGTLTLTGKNGETLKYAHSTEDKRMSRWTYSAYDGINGLFVHAKDEQPFRGEEPEDCGDGPD
jgi:hypothetical protein